MSLAARLAPEREPVDPFALPSSLPPLPADELGGLTGVYADRGVDRDGDDSFDELELAVGVAVGYGTAFEVVAWLDDGAGTPIVSAGTAVTLPVGVHSVLVPFDGQAIHEARWDGPYRVSKIELRVVSDRDMQIADSAENAYLTAAYASEAFAPLPAVLTGAATTATVDGEGNGLHDLLRFRVGLDVRQDGVYTIVGELTDGTRTIAVDQTTAQRVAGSRVINLEFDGATIFRSRRDGPYRLGRVWLWDAGGIRLDYATDVGMTGNLLHSAFEHGPAYLDTTAYQELPPVAGDENKFAVLEMVVGLVCDRPEAYSVLGALQTQAGERVAGSQGTVYCLPGLVFGGGETRYQTSTFTSTLAFDGRDIYASRLDGPYELSIEAVVSAAGPVIDAHPGAFTTTALRHSDFRSPYKSELALPLVLKLG